jgi:transcriptional antiterminator RfaH
MERWYAVFTKPRQEAVAVRHLNRQGFETYLPLMRRRRLRRGRLIRSEEPVFPRYVFLRVDLEQTNTASVRSTRGVVGFVRFGAYTAPVPDSLVAYLQAA